MRVASRIIGVVLAIAGLVFLGISVFLFFALRPESVLEGAGWGKRLTGVFFGAAVGVGFTLAGWYFFRLDVDRLDDADNRPPSRFAPFLLAHRRALGVIALVGLAVSVIRLLAVSFGRDWPAWPLFLAWISLVVIGSRIAKPGTADLDWQTVPERMRPVLRVMVKAGGVAFLIFGMLFAWNQWSHHQAPSRIVDSVFILLLFAWESLFFAYGAVRTDPEPTALPCGDESQRTPTGE